MDMTGQILSGLFALAIVIMIAPRILHVNRGKTLQNIALWVAIFLGLAVAYKIIGPGKDALAPAMEQSADRQTDTTMPGESEPETPALREEDGFSPPRE